MDRQRLARALMDVPTLSGRERRQVQAPAMPDPHDATAAMALGAVDVMGVPSGIAGLYNPALRDAMRGPQERNPEAAMVGSLPTTMMAPGWLSKLDPRLLASGLFGIGMTHKATPTSEID